MAMGQGGCMASEDAAVPAELLQSSKDIDAYAPRRRPRVDWVRRQSEALGRGALLPAAMPDAVSGREGAQQF